VGRVAKVAKAAVEVAGVAKIAEKTAVGVKAVEKASPGKIEKAMKAVKDASQDLKGVPANAVEASNKINQGGVAAENLTNTALRKGAGGPGSGAAAERAKNIAKGIPESELGPSGKPKIHVVEHSTQKQAKDAARAEVGKGGTTVKHPSPQEGGPHYHGETQQAERSRIHHEYPE
jgi:hypothetical protein